MRKSVLQSRLPPLPSQFSSQALHNRPSGSTEGKRRRRDYTPSSWDAYFETKRLVEINGGDKFCVYSSGNDGPVVLLLHGGGYSALSWAVMTKVLTVQCQCQVVAFDSRGHGSTVTSNTDDLSIDSQSRDVSSIMKSLYKESSPPPPVVVVGHSMGGAVAAHTVFLNRIPSVVGLVLIDVVEGSAMNALSSMQSFLRSRPQSFESIENAIEWSVRSGQTKNRDSARVSMPGQIRKVPTNNRVIEGNQEMGSANERIDEEDAAASQMTVADVRENSQYKYEWRIDLSKTEQHWKGWFEGLSQKFLGCTVAKLLLLAGVDRLDKDLTVGQMQGKFEMHVLPQVGHVVHEDSPGG
ncbi:protein phosphatase methylesterase 1-like isoform X2 [Corticium candelabrum]|uniref:protein phosphatase methylesterase 1-like isoform X2 n=1 Tax=Corticium candelabrum TaxID=121492 RepID=UPI002E264051|nr:protein phosphatase methylesterase 1-like isoform X2 [Corticium candelabrum]